MRRVLAATVLVVATACVDSQPVSLSPRSGSTAAPSDVLAGHTYVAINIDGDGRARLQRLKDLELGFGLDGRIEAGVGCNTFTGRYTFQESTLTVVDLEQTAMACADAAAAEDWLTDLFAEPRFPSYASDVGISFELDPVVVELEEATVYANRRAVVGTTWEVDAFSDWDTSVRGDVPKPGRIMLGRDGTYEAFDGCQAFGGQVLMRGDETIWLSEPPVAEPRPECAEHQRRMRVIFGADASYLTRADRMNVFGPDGGVLFKARR